MGSIIRQTISLRVVDRWTASGESLPRTNGGGRVFDGAWPHALSGLISKKSNAIFGPETPHAATKASPTQGPNLPTPYSCSFALFEAHCPPPLSAAAPLSPVLGKSDSSPKIIGTPPTPRKHHQHRFLLTVTLILAPRPSPTQPEPTPLTSNFLALIEFLFILSWIIHEGKKEAEFGAY